MAPAPDKRLELEPEIVYGASLGAKPWSRFPTGTSDRPQLPRPFRATLNPGFKLDFKPFLSASFLPLFDRSVNLLRASRLEAKGGKNIFLYYLDARSCCDLSAVGRIKSFRIILGQEIPAGSQVQQLFQGNCCRVEMRR